MKEKKEGILNCSGCSTYPCYRGEDCIRNHDFQDYYTLIDNEYNTTENRRILEVSSLIEAEHYMDYTRLEEIIDFAQRMGYQKIGIARLCRINQRSESPERYFRQ